jgi:hypothetical protein
MPDARRDAFQAASATGEETPANKRAFREKHRKKSRRSKGARKFVDGFGDRSNETEFSEDTDENFHAPSACGILLLVLVPLLASALLTAFRAKETS